MEGYVYLNEEALGLDIDFEYWRQLVLDFNLFPCQEKR